VNAYHARLAFGLVVSLLPAGPARVAAAVGDVAPVSVRTAPGRFEIATVDATAAHAVATLAEEAWRSLAGPLALPEGFSSPIYIRLLPVGEDAAERPFRVLVEPGGIVSVRLPVAELGTLVGRRAIVQALLMRLAVSRQGVSDRLTAPLWLEQACVGWWSTRADGARLDALKQESNRLSPPDLTALLGWQRGREEPRPFVVGALWLLTFLQSESGREHQWATFLPRLLDGEEPLAALVACYPGRFDGAEERELWWQTGYHYVRRIRTLPALEAVDSRAQLGALARFVFADASGEKDVVVPLRIVLARRADPMVAAEIPRRRLEVERLIPALHPFYRNAGLSLAELLHTGPPDPKHDDATCATFQQDWADAVELESAANAALDTIEQRMSRG
jgi:hypothetical protein